MSYKRNPIFFLWPVSLLTIICFWIVQTCVLFGVCDSVSADIRLPKIFSDHMVLQRNQEIKIWGWSLANEELSISFGDFTTAIQANDQGRWSSVIPAMEAGGPFDLKVIGKDASVVIADVFVGEVWLCAGESNMEMSLEETLECETEEEKLKLLSEFNNDRIRFFKIGHSSVEKRPDDLTEAASWAHCNPESAKTFSAVAFHFANHLLQQLDVSDELGKQKIVIGLIESSWGGSPCEAWISDEGLSGQEELKPLVTHWKNNTVADPGRPSMMFNGMIAPIVDYPIRGTIFYQGESNVSRGRQYQFLLPALINDWRSKFGESMPFYFVQLTPFRYDDFDPKELPELWEAQLGTLGKLDGIGMATTGDIGQVDNINPKNKTEVGRRLALLALANTYEFDQLVASGPMLQDSLVDGSSIVLSFSNVGSGLQSTEGDLNCFLICGDNGEFVEAKAEIESKNSIRVSASGVLSPKAVRFAWSDTSQPNLFNSAGLPASPFRTDDFDLLSKGIHY